MAFTLTLGFATEHNKSQFEERILPKLRAAPAAAAAVDGAEADGLKRVSLSVTSPSAARDVCRQVVAFLAHAKGLRVDVEWLGADGAAQRDQIEAGEQRQAERVEIRLSMAAKAHLDSEKAS